MDSKFSKSNGVFVTILLTSILVANSTIAADLQPQITEPAGFTWAGVYGGINGGWGQARDDRRLFAVRSIAEYNTDGGVIGGQIGYRWQKGNWVLGLEAQGDWADISGDAANHLVPGGGVRSKMNALGLFTGQVGYAWNSVLLYTKSGAAITNRDYKFFNNGKLVSNTGDETRLSPMLGAGVELALSHNWSLGLEYDHIFEERHDVSFKKPNDPAVSGFTGGGNSDMVFARLNFMFGG